MIGKVIRSRSRALKLDARKTDPAGAIDQQFEFLMKEVTKLGGTFKSSHIITYSTQEAPRLFLTIVFEVEGEVDEK